MHGMSPTGTSDEQTDPLVVEDRAEKTVATEAQAPCPVEGDDSHPDRSEDDE